MRRLFALLVVLVASLLSARAESHVASLPALSVVLQGYTEPEVKMRMSESGMHRVEGVWRFTGDGATVAVERIGDSDRYRMVLVSSPNRALRPGTLVGHISPTAEPCAYDARIYTSCRGTSVLHNARRFTLRLRDDDSRLAFKPHKSRYALNLWRMLPYLFRYSVRRNADTDAGIQGCVRVFPTPLSPVEPCYL